MATGDLTNNVRKLKTKLKIIKYSDDLELVGLTEGKAAVFLPVFHHAFTRYSQPLADFILSKDFELYGKSDSRFMEAVYKILRDIFSYKPPITKDQFFAKGFAERKVIMCTEVLQHVIAKHKQLNPAGAKTAMKTSVRPSSAIEPRDLPMAVPKTKRPASAKVSPRLQNGATGAMTTIQASQRQPAGAHVVNELTCRPPNEPVRHTAQPLSSMAMTRHVARSADHSEQSHVEPPQPRPPRHVSIQSPDQADSFDGASMASMASMGDGSWERSPEQPRPSPFPQTPSIRKACPYSVEVVTMPKVNEFNDQSAIEIRAATSESILDSTVPTLELNVQHQISQLTQSMETLTGQVMRFDDVVRDLQATRMTSSDPYVHALEEKIQGQLSNLMARMVLLENRVSMLEVKVDETHKGSHMPPEDSTLTAMQNANLPSSFSEDLKSISAVHKFQQALQEHSNLSLGYSPIRKITNNLQGEMMTAGNEDTFALESEDDARRSSTPTALNQHHNGGNGHSLLGESSICCNFADSETNDAVSRIKNMMKETKTILADQKLQPGSGSTS